MSSPRSPESHAPTRVGPRPLHALRRCDAGAGTRAGAVAVAAATTMPPEYLPVEIWHLIITELDDLCFAWLVLRQVCPFLTAVTDDVFSRYVRTCISIRFAGQRLRNLFLPPLQHDTGNALTGYVAGLSEAPVRLPSFRFQPQTFVPASSKQWLVFKLCDAPTAHDTLPLHPTYAGPVESTARLTEVFFQPGAVADAERTRLLNQAHFVLLNDQLKSLRLPSADFNVVEHELTLDWRRLCDAFMRDAFRCRYTSTSAVTWWRKFGQP